VSTLRTIRTAPVSLRKKNSETSGGNEIVVYENWHHGFRCNKIENRKNVENYLTTYYPDQTYLIKIDYDKLVGILNNMEK